MNSKLRSSLIVLAFVSAISVTKLVFFFLSQSLAVWSEVWHSFSDMATTMLVVISFWLAARSAKINAKAPEPASTDEQEPAPSAPPKKRLFTRLLAKCHGPKFESTTALIIAAALITISISIIYQAILGQRFVVKRPIISGIGFIMLSLASYFIYRFEGLIAEDESSSALKADSLHNRADMLVSLMTGFSLLLYHFGYNIDRYMGGITGLFVFSFAIELLVNNLRNLLNKEEKAPIELSFGAMLSHLFSAAFWQKIAALVRKKIIHSPKIAHYLNRVEHFFKKLFYILPKAAILGAILYYLSTCFYLVDTGEKALLFRFGSLETHHEAIGPGLHLKWPFPIERAEKFNTERVLTFNLGLDVSSAGKRKKARLWSIDHGDSMQFITGDNNLFLPTISVSYHIKDLHKYLLKQSNAEKLIKNMALKLATSWFASYDFYSLALYSSNWPEQLARLLQKSADEVDLGIAVDSLLVAGLHPPTTISTSFERVVAAYQEKETAINLAYRTGSSDLATARVTAYKKSSEAQIDHDKKVLLSSGEAASYLLQCAEFNQNPALISRYKKLETAEAVLSKKDLFLVDEEAHISNNLLYYDVFKKP